MKNILCAFLRVFMAQLSILALALTATPSHDYFLTSNFQMISHAAAATCGGRNQKPCPIWTGRKSCDRGLVENFAKGRCVAKAKKKPKPNKPKPTNCGRQNQRPCPIWTGRKSCDAGLVENFAKGRCVRPAPKPVPGKNCGLENQRPCPITTGRKSCVNGLIEDFKKNRCVRPAANQKCGGLNQRPCPVWTGRQSCNPGLVENFAKGRCVPKPVPGKNCGLENQRPCPITTGKKSCAEGLYEDFNRNLCVRPAANAQCGALNQKPCPIWTGRQSCNPGLVEAFGQNRCVSPQAHNCGALNQRPCLIITGRQSCDPGLVEDFVGNICVKPGQGLEQVKALAKSCINKFATVASALVPLSACMANPNLQNVLRQPGARNNPVFLQQQIFAQCSAQVQQAFNTVASKGLRSITVGLGGDLGGGLSLNSELFLAFNTTLQGGIHKYASVGWRVGAHVTAGAEVVVGAHADQAANLAGTGQSVAFGGKALGGVSIAAHTSFAGGGNNAQCTGISISPGVGVEVNAGSVGRSITVKVP